jgi:hypothetical protein
MGFSRKLIKETIAAPTHNDNLRRGVWEASICYQILLLKREAEAWGYKPKEAEDPAVEAVHEEDIEKSMSVVSAAIEEYKHILMFFKQKGLIGAQGVQQVDARLHFNNKMRKKEEEVIKPELKAKAAEKAATNGGGRNE